MVLGRPRVLESDAIGGLHDGDLVHDAPMFVAVESRQYARAVEEPELHGHTAPSPRRRGAPVRYGARRYPVSTSGALRSAGWCADTPLSSRACAASRCSHCP